MVVIGVMVVIFNSWGDVTGNGGGHGICGIMVVVVLVFGSGGSSGGGCRDGESTRLIESQA